MRTSRLETLVSLLLANVLYMYRYYIGQGKYYRIINWFVDLSFFHYITHDYKNDKVSQVFTHIIFQQTPTYLVKFELYVALVNQ